MMNGEMTTADIDRGLTPYELDILQEVVNIAFGKASSDLAETVDVFVVMSVPEVKLLRESEVKDYLVSEIGSNGASSVVEQRFWGRFKGASLLFFTPEAGLALTYILNDAEEHTEACDDMEQVRESMTAAGSILAAACVGKIAECLNDMVTYSPPYYAEVSGIKADITDNSGPAEENRLTVVIKTPFCLDRDGINGFLMLVAAPEALGWLKDSLNRFMERYG